MTYFCPHHETKKKPHLDRKKCFKALEELLFSPFNFPTHSILVTKCGPVYMLLGPQLFGNSVTNGLLILCQDKSYGP